jgi:predicted metal-dependent phosphoesterase TrpH
MPADLHLHTSFSDGTFSPEELVAHAVREHLTTIALTDHDTVEGCPRTAAACRSAGLEFVPATELTAELVGVELHLLGYHLDTGHAALLAAMARFQTARTERIHAMIERLNRLGIPLDASSVFALAQCRSPGRPHVARALVARGICSSVDEAFTRFLKRDRPAWAPKAHVTVEDAIRLIHEAGGIAVLAHPGLNQADPFLPRLIELGLDGIECFHSRHTTSTAEYYVDVARRHALLVTGGSDCHGMAKGQPLIGTVKLAQGLVDALRDAAAQRRAGRPSALDPRSALVALA